MFYHVAEKAGHSEKCIIVQLPNFAYQEIGRFVFGDGCFAVSGNDQRIGGTIKNDSGPPEISPQVLGQTVLIPKYIKETNTARYVFEDALECVESMDIDISEDGKLWYHLIGAFCFLDYPEVRIVRGFGP